MIVNLVEETLNLYQATLKSNDLYNDLQDMRQRADYFEQKYKEELAINDEKIKRIWTANYEKKYKDEVEMNKTHVRNIA